MLSKCYQNVIITTPLRQRRAAHHHYIYSWVLIFMSEKGDPHNACYEWIEERATAERNVNEMILDFTHIITTQMAVTLKNLIL